MLTAGSPESRGFAPGAQLPPAGFAARFEIQADGAGGELWRLRVDAARAAGRLVELGRHRVGGFVAAGQDDAGTWLVRLAPATSLAAWLDQRPGPVDGAQACSLAVSLAEAAAACEQASLFPGPIDPDTVAVRGEAMEIRADGLVAALLGTGGTIAAPRSGGRWLAPEQADGQPPDSASNRYAIGLLLYRMLSGAHPFAGRGLRRGLDDQRQRGAPPIDQSIAAALPPGLHAVCLRLLDPRSIPPPRLGGDPGVAAALLALAHAEAALDTAGRRRRRVRWPDPDPVADPDRRRGPVPEPVPLSVPDQDREAHARPPSRPLAHHPPCRGSPHRLAHRALRRSRNGVLDPRRSASAAHPGARAGRLRILPSAPGGGVAPIGDGPRGRQPAVRVARDAHPGAGRTRQRLSGRRRHPARGRRRRVSQPRLRSAGDRLRRRAVVRQLPRPGSEPGRVDAGVERPRRRFADSPAAARPPARLGHGGHQLRRLPSGRRPGASRQPDRGALRGQSVVDLGRHRPALLDAAGGRPRPARHRQQRLLPRPVGAAGSTRRGAGARRRPRHPRTGSPALPRVERVLRGLPRRATVRHRRAGRPARRRALQATAQRLQRVGGVARRPAPRRPRARDLPGLPHEPVPRRVHPVGGGAGIDHGASDGGRARLPARHRVRAAPARDLRARSRVGRLGGVARHLALLSGVDLPLAPGFDRAALDDPILDVTGIPLGARQRRDLLLARTFRLAVDRPGLFGGRLEIRLSSRTSAPVTASRPASARSARSGST